MDTELISGTGRKGPTAMQPSKADKTGDRGMAVSAKKRRRQSSGAGQQSAEIERCFMQSVNLICVAGFDGYFKRLNLAWEPLLGYSIEELMARPFMSLVHPDDYAATLAEVQRLAGGATTISFEHRCRSKDGSDKWILWNATPFLDLSGFCATGHDITERKRLETELRQAQKMEAVGRLAGGVAHEFNNLLQIIQGYGENLLESFPADSEDYQDLQEILKASNRASSLTRQLLTFGRRQALHRANHDLKHLVSDLMKMIRPLLGTHIDVSVHADDQVCVTADAGMLQQAFLNLCLNARDAMPRGGKLTIALDRLTEETGIRDKLPQMGPAPWVRVRVSDTGGGIPPETLPKLFEPFFTTKAVGQGTGLGLATVYGIVEQHWGGIEVDSELGVGTTFTMYFPAVAGHSDVHDDVDRPLPSGVETVLVAEDEPAIRNFVSRELLRAGYTVLTAENGEDAVRLFEQHASEISLVLLDVVMPRLTGLLAYQAMKAIKPTPVLFLSGYDQQAFPVGSHSHGNIELLQKPIDRDALLQRIRAMLDARAVCASG